METLNQLDHGHHLLPVPVDLKPFKTRILLTIWQVTTSRTMVLFSPLCLSLNRISLASVMISMPRFTSRRTSAVRQRATTLFRLAPCLTSLLLNFSQPLGNADAAVATHGQHWAFQPVKRPQVPTISQGNAIDALLQAERSKLSLDAQPKADPRTLIRRVYLDLTGLPPSPETVEAFTKDPSPAAYRRVVDQLLASPRYGERWGRYWLDIARYADTKGYVFEEERRYPYSYTYRDYVIDAFNKDLPYDQFLIQQMAADKLDLGDDPSPLAGLGFLTLGRRFLNNIHDIIDDRMDVVFRGTMGITIGCARCHDHKFDPVPSKDYYSLYGVFASSSEPAEKPLLGKSSLPPAYPEYVAERKKRQDELDTFRSTKSLEAVDEVRRRTGDYLMTASEAILLNDGSKAEAKARERKLDPGIMNKWKDRLTNKDWTNKPMVAEWLTLSRAVTAAKTNEVAAAIAATAQPWMAQSPATAASTNLARLIQEAKPDSLSTLAGVFNKLCSEVDVAWKTASKPGEGKPAITSLSNLAQESVRQLLYDADSPANVPAGEIPRLFDVPTAQKSRALQRKVEELDATHEGAPPRAMALVENQTPHNPRVFIRGNPGNQGDAVPRQFLGFLSNGARKPFEKGGGRLELAKSIASPQNPLTARVFANRVWMYHFGTPLVKPPSDFGVRSDPATQPALLDFLAAEFMAQGWSVKSLHRLMLLSETYQLSSQETAANASKDPANLTYWRMNRRRLDFESSRDTLLQISDRLSGRIGGHAEEIATAPDARRRTVYGFIDRQNLPGMFRTFDFANPDTSSSQRFTTTVPQQALFLLNNPFVRVQATGLLERPAVKKASTSDAKIQALYRATYQRAADPDEINQAKAFVQSGPTAAAAGAAESDRWIELAQVLLVSNEVFFFD